MYIEKVFRSLSSAHEKWGQKQKYCVYNFVQYLYIYKCTYCYGKAELLAVITIKIVFLQIIFTNTSVLP